jgi:putative tricarboxylic transport membrane protein
MTNIALALVAFLIAALYSFGIFQIPLLGFGDPLGPRLFPSVLAGSLVLIGLSLLILGGNARSACADLKRFSAYLKHTDFRAVAAIVAWTGLYYVAFVPVGYLVSTTILLLGLILAFHRGGRLIGAGVAVLFATGTYFLFSGLFGVALPRGIIPL